MGLMHGQKNEVSFQCSRCLRKPLLHTGSYNFCRMELYANMDAALLCKLFFYLGATVDIGGTLIPSFREKIMNYGSRSTTSHRPPSSSSLFEYVASIQVPHTWFTHYYIVSVLSSMFWGYQIYTRGPVLGFLASHAHPETSKVTANQALLGWLFMAIQGSRRLHESITLTKSSRSTMWFGLWLVGMAYYVVMGTSVWIEGAGKPQLAVIGPLILNVLAALDQRQLGKSLLDFSRPSAKTLIAVPLFVLASIAQHESHVHLASLKKYTLPHHYLFRRVVCPHYTSECVVYIAIAIVAAPPGQVLNRTVLAGIGFVASNLGVTADSTRKWYAEKFGADQLVGRWRMVPYVY